MIYIAILVVIGIVIAVVESLFLNSRNIDDTNINKNAEYYKKELMTASELKFYNTLKELESNYKIVPQVCLNSIMKNNKKYNTELYKIVDFGIFSNDYSELLLLIELNDDTHNLKKRKIRDKKVKEMCEKAGIELMTFYTKYPNNRDYVITRIKESIYKSTNK